MLVHYLEKLGIKSRRGYVFLKQSDLVGIDGIHVECKYCEKLNARAALDQAIEEAEKRKDGLPVVFWKVTRKPWVCIMRTDDFATLYKLAKGVVADGPNEEIISVIHRQSQSLGPAE